jgi:WD40-like Beta Propeller Repeat
MGSDSTPISDRVASRDPGSPRPTEGPDLSFPGGGLILYQPAQGPAYERRGIGVVTSKGDVVERPIPDVLPYWDPAARRGVIAIGYNRGRGVRSYSLSEGALSLAGRWRTHSENLVAVSFDGRSIADIPFHRNGRIITGEARIIDRNTGAVRDVDLGGDLVVEAWTPGGHLLVVPWSGGQRVLVDPSTLERQPFEFLPPAWAPNGHAFAVNVSRRHGRDLGIGIGRGRELRRRTWLGGGRRVVETPTWSPDGRRVAVIVRGGGPRGERTADLVVIEAATGMKSVLAHRVSDAWWVSWAPDGEWILVDDWTRDRWLFVSADGERTIVYPWLGSSPRWCCPSSPPIDVTIPVS